MAERVMFFGRWLGCFLSSLVTLALQGRRTKNRKVIRTIFPQKLYGTESVQPLTVVINSGLISSVLALTRLLKLELKAS